MPGSTVTMTVSSLLLQNFGTPFLPLYSPTPTIFSLLREMSVTTYETKHLIFYGAELDLCLLPVSAPSALKKNNNNNNNKNKNTVYNCVKKINMVTLRNIKLKLKDSQGWEKMKL